MLLNGVRVHQELFFGFILFYMYIPDLANYKPRVVKRINCRKIRIQSMRIKCDATERSADPVAV